MAPPGRRAAGACDLSSLRSLADQMRLKLAAKRRSPVTRASFDPVRVEAELYDALYGRRTGTVDNIVPVSSDVAAEQMSVASATSAQYASRGRREKGREGLDPHEPDVRHAA